jgi:hypothetical protein
LAPRIPALITYFYVCFLILIEIQDGRNLCFVMLYPQAFKIAPGESQHRINMRRKGKGRKGRRR